MALDKYMGRQMYPKDTVTRKQMDRQDDRQTRRIDLYKEKHLRLQKEVRLLQTQMSRLLDIIEIDDVEEEKQS